MGIQWQEVCPGCGVTGIHYWIHTPIWQAAEQKAGRKLGQSCPACVEAVLARPLTLNDLSIKKYQNSINHRLVVQETVRATIIGACREVQLGIPIGWLDPIPEHIAELEGLVGARLARQTPDAAQVIPNLVAEANNYFPVVIAPSELLEVRMITKEWCIKQAEQRPWGEIQQLWKGLNRPARQSQIAKAARQVAHLAKGSPIGGTATGQTEPVRSAIREGIKDGIQEVAQRMGKGRPP